MQCTWALQRKMSYDMIVNAVPQCNKQRNNVTEYTRWCNDGVPLVGDLLLLLLMQCIYMIRSDRALIQLEFGGSV